MIEMQPRSGPTAQQVMRMWRAALGENGKPLSLRKFVAELNAVDGASAITFQAAGLWLAGRALPVYGRVRDNFQLADESSWQRSFWRDMRQAVEARNAAREARECARKVRK